MSWWFGWVDAEKWVPPFSASSAHIASQHLVRTHGPEYVLKGPCESQFIAWHAIQKELTQKWTMTASSVCALCNQERPKIELGARSQICDECIHGMQRLEVAANHD